MLGCGPALGLQESRESRLLFALAPRAFADPPHRGKGTCASPATYHLAYLYTGQAGDEELVDRRTGGRGDQLLHETVESRLAGGATRMPSASALLYDVESEVAPCRIIRPLARDD